MFGKQWFNNCVISFDNQYGTDILCISNYIPCAICDRKKKNYYNFPQLLYTKATPTYVVAHVAGHNHLSLKMNDFSFLCRRTTLSVWTPFKVDTEWILIHDKCFSLKCENTWKSHRHCNCAVTKQHPNASMLWKVNKQEWKTVGERDREDRRQSRRRGSEMKTMAVCCMRGLGVMWQGDQCFTARQRQWRRASDTSLL